MLRVRVRGGDWMHFYETLWLGLEQFFERRSGDRPMVRVRASASFD